MKCVLLLLPSFLSLLIFSAHLFRAGALIFVPFLLASLLLLCIRHGLVARFFQLLLLFVALQWVLVALFLANERMNAGVPWIRMTVILGSVALFALISAALFEAPPLLRRYPRHILSGRSTS